MMVIKKEEEKKINDEETMIKEMNKGRLFWFLDREFS